MEHVSIVPDGPEPPFAQLRAQLAAAVSRGDLPPGTRLPTVRAAAADLGLAVNTVARAYRELEADRVVVTRGRKGTFVRSAAVDGTTDAAAALRGAAAGYAGVARTAGLTRAEAHRLLDEAWG
jgi:DNA-binding transcriptional regulator YhcF (GntR family)